MERKTHKDDRKEEDREKRRKPVERLLRKRRGCRVVFAGQKIDWHSRAQERQEMVEPVEARREVRKRTFLWEIKSNQKSLSKGLLQCTCIYVEN